MRKIFIAILLTIATVASIHAQTRLVGRIISPEQDVIEGVVVTLANQGITTTTNAEGRFTLTYLDAIDEEVIIEATGYISDVLLVELKENQLNDLGDVVMQVDFVREAQEEVLLTLTDMDMNDDEGKSQSVSSASSASQDVFNSTVSFAWSNARYRGRGYDQIYEENYIEGLNFIQVIDFIHLIVFDYSHISKTSQISVIEIRDQTIYR